MGDLDFGRRARLGWPSAELGGDIPIRRRVPAALCALAAVGLLAIAWLASPVAELAGAVGDCGEVGEAANPCGPTGDKTCEPSGLTPRAAAKSESFPEPVYRFAHSLVPES